VAGVHFVGGEKGGVGKSVVSRLLAQFFIDHQLSFVGLDGDASHPALLRYYSDRSEPLEIHELESMDRIVEYALAEPDRRVLVDLPAQSALAVRRWVDGGDVTAIASEDELPICFWHVTDGGFDSVELLSALVQQYAKEVGYVIVRNHGRSRDFSQLNDSQAIAEVRALGGRVIDLPELHPAAMYRIDRYGSSFWAAGNDTTSELRLSTMDRRRVQKWIQRVYGEFDALGDLL